MVAELNYALRPQQTDEEPTRSAKSHPEAGNKPVATGNSDPDQAAGLPPFNILLQWLTYYHTETGAWPEPGKDKSPVTHAAEHPQSNNKPTLTILPTRPRNLRATSAEPDMTGMSEYDFRSSIYYRAAYELVEKHAPATLVLNDCETNLLVFSSFLAWCHHPAFLTFQPDRLNESGLEMYLSLEQWSKGLKMRKATIGVCLKELEAQGLIEVCLPPTRLNYGKTVNRCYRLAVELPAQLPAFELSAAKQSSREPASKGREPIITTVPSEGTGSDSGSENNPMNMVSKIHESKTNKIKAKNHEHGCGPATEMGTDDEKMDFLAQKATFPGYTSPEGLSALARGEALKFASNPALDLFTIRQVYMQVLAAWSSGRCTKNPIGFFHYTLSQRLKQKEAGPTGRAKSSKPVTWEPVPPTPETDWTCTEAQSPEVDESIDLKENQIGREEVVDKGIDIEIFQKSLKNEIIEAVENRFRQPELAVTLSRFNWIYSLVGSRLLINLENTGVYSLTQGDLSLLRIAISQKLRNQLGTNLEFEIGF